MTKATWVKLVVTSFGAAALLGAAQLGVGQALSIINIGSDLSSSSDDAYHRLTTWLIFIFAGSILGGVAVGRRYIRRRVSIVTRQVPTVPRMTDRVRTAVTSARAPVALASARVVATLCAGLGAVTAFPLVWIPAHGASAAAATRVTLTAGIGLLLGLLFAFGWESWVPSLPGDFSKVSLMAYLRVLAPHPQPKSLSGGELQDVLASLNPQSISHGLAWVVLSCVIFAALAGAIVVFSEREYAPREDAA